MKNVTEIKSLGDIRTATSHHIAAKPPLKGTTHLDMYLLDKEKQRLEKELTRLGQRQRRIRERITDIDKAMAKLEETVQRTQVAGDSSARPAVDQSVVSGEEPSGRQWKRMSIDY